nr:hypothetical protein [Tanacetum cinerariifolium]
MVNGKWITMRPKVTQFCGVYHNVTRRAVSEAEDGDYTQQSLLEYQAESRVPFTLLHARAELKDCHIWKEDGSINLNMQVIDNEEENVREVQRQMGRDTTKKKGATSSASSTSSNKEPWL